MKSVKNEVYGFPWDHARRCVSDHSLYLIRDQVAECICRHINGQVWWMSEQVRRHVADIVEDQIIDKVILPDGKTG